MEAHLVRFRAGFVVVVLPTTILMGYWLVVGGFVVQSGWFGDEPFHFDLLIPTTSYSNGFMNMFDMLNMRNMDLIQNLLLLGMIFSPPTTYALVW